MERCAEKRLKRRPDLFQVNPLAETWNTWAKHLYEGSRKLAKGQGIKVTEQEPVKPALSATFPLEASDNSLAAAEGLRAPGAVMPKTTFYNNGKFYFICCSVRKPLAI